MTGSEQLSKFTVFRRMIDGNVQFDNQQIFVDRARQCKIDPKTFISIISFVLLLSFFCFGNKLEIFWDFCCIKKINSIFNYYRFDLLRFAIFGDRLKLNAGIFDLFLTAFDWIFTMKNQNRMEKKRFSKSKEKKNWNKLCKNWTEWDNQNTKKKFWKMSLNIQINVNRSNGSMVRSFAFQWLKLLLSNYTST